MARVAGINIPDNKHTEMMKEFNRIKEEDIPKILGKIKNIKKKLENDLSLEERLEKPERLPFVRTQEYQDQQRYQN